MCECGEGVKVYMCVCECGEGVKVYMCVEEDKTPGRPEVAITFKLFILQTTRGLETRQL